MSIFSIGRQKSEFHQEIKELLELNAKLLSWMKKEDQAMYLRGLGVKGTSVSFTMEEIIQLLTDLREKTKPNKKDVSAVYKLLDVLSDQMLVLTGSIDEVKAIVQKMKVNRRQHFNEQIGRLQAQVNEPNYAEHYARAIIALEKAKSLRDQTDAQLNDIEKVWVESAAKIIKKYKALNTLICRNESYIIERKQAA